MNLELKSYRNSYLTIEGSPEYQIWEGLVKRRLALQWKSLIVSDNETYFGATEHGALKVLKQGESLGDNERRSFDRWRTGKRGRGRPPKPSQFHIADRRRG